MHNFKIKKE